MPAGVESPDESAFWGALFQGVSMIVALLVTVTCAVTYQDLGRIEEMVPQLGQNRSQLKDKVEANVEGLLATRLNDAQSFASNLRSASLDAARREQSRIAIWHESNSMGMSKLFATIQQNEQRIQGLEYAIGRLEAALNRSRYSLSTGEHSKW